MIPISARNMEYLLGILATALIAIGLGFYAFGETGRLDNAQASQLQNDLDGAMTLYAENCAVCHGMMGEGMGATPSLNNPGTAGASPQDLFKVVARGRYDTAMPAWGLEDGGPLSDYQIGMLVTLIQSGDWQATQDRVVNLGLAPLIPFAAQPDPLFLEQVQALAGGELLAQGIALFGENCVACHGADGLGTSLAPALNDPQVQAKDPAELERILLNGVPSTLMAGWDNVLDEAESAALIALLTRWDEVPVGTIPAPDRPAPVTAESLALGAGLYSQSCSRCHGPEGQGTPRAPALNVKSFLTGTVDGAIQQIITLGVPGTAMPAWGDRLGEAEIQALVSFIRTWEENAPEVATPARGGGPWWARQSSAPALPSGGLSSGAGAKATQAAGQQTEQSASQRGQETGGGPPWAQPASPGWTLPDWRVILLLTSTLAVGIWLALKGISGLRRASDPGV